MSKFLGPIHYWLFNKIFLYENLESDIIESIEQKLNISLWDITKELHEKIGLPLENKPLEELIDTNNIHGWLQNKITIAETRQAALITFIVNKYGEKGMNIIKNCYKEQAVKSGKDAKSNYDVISASAIYKTLNNYILDGMPCDNVNNITVNEDTKLEWRVLNCLHKNYWINVSGNLDILYELRNTWISNFIQSVNSNYEYNFKIENMDNNKLLIHEIVKTV
jgi:hypothetical protein